MNTRPRYTFDETRNRHETVRRIDLQVVEREQSAFFGGVSNPDVDFFDCAVGTVFADLESVGHELHGHADLRHVRAEHRRLGAVDVEFPFDAGHRTCVVDVAQSLHLRVHVFAHTCHRRLEQSALARSEFEFDRFSDAWALLHRFDFDRHAG